VGITYVVDIMAPNCFPAVTNRSLMCCGGWKYLHLSRRQRSWVGGSRFTLTPLHRLQHGASQI